MLAELIYNPSMAIPPLLNRLAAPAQRAILAAGIRSLEELAGMTEAQLKSLHGIGPHALKTIRAMLAEHGMALKPE